MKKYFVIFFLFFCIKLYSQNDFYEVGGYIKYLFSNTKAIDNKRLNDHLLHFRLNTKLYFSENLVLTSEFRNRIFFGQSIEQNENFLETKKSKHDLGNADFEWWKNKNSIGYSEIDRFYFDYTFNNLQFTIGRQRIAWGTALIWNPTDIFNPLSILDFDYEERPSVDAFRAQIFFSEVSKGEIVFKPGKTKEKTIIASKVLLNNWNYDFHFIFGFKFNKPFLGFEWAGDIFGAGFRGEVLYSKILSNNFTSSLNISNKYQASLALSADYTFSNTLYIHSELLFNDRGLVNNYYLADLYMKYLNLINPAKWSLYQEISYEFHPLLRASIFNIINLIDKSGIVVPSFHWSLQENLDIVSIFLLCYGNAQTEYGEYGSSFLISLKFSF